MTAALIVTAGRTGSGRELVPSKLVGSIPAVRRIARVFRQAGLQRIVVVCGEEQVKKDAGHLGVVFLQGQPEGEMLDNVKTGLAYLQDRCRSAFITHANVPLFSVGTVRALSREEGEALVPVCRGASGHPMLLRAERFPEILAYTGEGGLAGAVKAAGIPCRGVEVEDEGVVANIASGETYEELVDGHDLKRTGFDLRLRLVGESVFYGPGAHQLLELTGETGSLLEACRQMGISYSKGRKIVSAIERQTGSPVLESRQGGPAGGGSVLTEQGRELMERYAAFRQEADTCLKELFEKHFPG